MARIEYVTKREITGINTTDYRVDYESGRTRYYTVKDAKSLPKNVIEFMENAKSWASDSPESRHSYVIFKKM